MESGEIQEISSESAPDLDEARAFPPDVRQDTIDPSQSRNKRPIIETKWNLLPCILLFLFVCSTAFYLWIRVTTLTSPYAIFILISEILGTSSLFPYAILLCRGTYPSGSKGLPAAAAASGEDGDVTEPADECNEKRFSVHVLIPCYKEPLNVIAGTVLAALNAHLPESTRRTVYLLDDGGSIEKRAFIESLENPQAKYITGRERTPGQVNGKSENLNHALRNHVFKKYLTPDAFATTLNGVPASDIPNESNLSGREGPTDVSALSASSSSSSVVVTLSDGKEFDWRSIPSRELVVVFDADMRAKPDFFLKTLEVMSDESLQLVLTPQAFHNIDPECDLFNNINKQFWEYWLPGAFAWGYIACTGTNFMIRARALASCGWFPDKTVTEDYMLGMELKARGHRATYLMSYLAEGEAPDEARNVFQQRSRWTKGHYQVFFSWGNPLFHSGLPLFQRLWYCYAAWAPFCNTATAPIFMLVPFMSIVFGYHPVSISFMYVIAATVFLASVLSIQYYVRDLEHLRSMWFVNISNTVLWFTYTKALFNTGIARMANKTMSFKVTTKGNGALKSGDANTLLGNKLDWQHDADSMYIDKTGDRHQATFKALHGHSPGGIIGDADTIQTSWAGGLSLWSTTSGESSTAATSCGDSLAGSSASRLAKIPLPHHHPEGSLPPRSSEQSGDSMYIGVIGSSPTAARGLASLLPINTKGRVSKLSSVKGGDFSPSTYMTNLRARTGAHVSWQGKELASENRENAHHASEDAAGGGGAASAYAVVVPVLPSPEGAVDEGKDDERQHLLGRKDSHSAGMVRSTLGRLKTLLVSYKPQHVTQDFGQMMDPAVLLLMFLFSVITGFLGISELVRSSSNHSGDGGNVAVSLILDSPIYGSPFLIIATLWAFYNAVAPYLFLHYCASTGPSFRFMAKWLCVLSTGVMITSLAFAWLVIPATIKPSDALGLAIKHLYPSSIATDTNTNFNFVTGLGMEPFDINVDANLLGGLWTSDNVKHGMPLAYTLTILSWSLLNFPSAFSGREGQVLITLRAGASYLMACDLTDPNRPDSPVFVAQVGDASAYVVLQDPGYDPVAQGKVWTGPKQDPTLVGADPRPVWLLTGDLVGADLLSGSAAALAAVGMVFRGRDPVFSAAAVAKAQQILRFATIQDERPSSYCRFVPCTTNVTITKHVITKNTPLMNNSLSVAPTCFYIEWISQTCRIGSTLQTCLEVYDVNSDIFKSRIDCCSALFKSTNHTPQGICAIPDDGSNKCYVPDSGLRTCFEETINPLTGAGCSGKGLSIFLTPLACCESLSSAGVIAPDQGRAGTGLCSRAGLDSSFGECWVPSVYQGTCVKMSKSESGCSGFGIETSYDSPTACCNRVLQLLTTGDIVQGGIGVWLSGICASEGGKSNQRRSSMSGQQQQQWAPPGGASAVSQENGFMGRRLSADDPIPRWKRPGFDAASACSDGDCKEIQLTEVKEVPLYNSTSVLDDMAWGAVWLYKATGNPSYLGQAQRYLERHYKEDITEQTLYNDRSYYVSSWNNVAWATNILLADLTDSSVYHDRLSLLFKTWVYGDVVTPPSFVLEPDDIGQRFDHLNPFSSTFIDPNTGDNVSIVPDCIPTAAYEDQCFNGIDDDCNGFIDRDDITCGLFPVQYTKSKLAFTSKPALPNSANTAFLSLVYAEQLADRNKKNQLQCWSLGQATYMLGGYQGVNSFVIGYGPSPPTIVQQMASSCPAQRNGSYSSADMPCSWDSGFFPGLPNPNIGLVQGGLVWGPSDGSDGFDDSGRRSDDTRIRLEDNVGFTGLLAGLSSSSISVNTCFLGHGLWQYHMQTNDEI